MRERRFKKERSARKVFLVICEGETEKVYIEALKQHYRLPIAIKTKVSGNKICARLVREYLKELDLSVGDECRIFYVYDADVDCVTNKLDTLPGDLILSNPCIELWYILHHRDQFADIRSNMAVRSLSNCDPIWIKYTKGFLSREQFKTLMERRELAMERSKKLHWPANPSSNFYKFIEALEECKNA